MNKYLSAICLFCRFERNTPPMEHPAFRLIFLGIMPK